MQTIKQQILEIVANSDPNGCWASPGRRCKRGYGWVHHRPTHKVMYEEFVRPLTRDEILRHICGDKGCFNPAHLSVVKGFGGERKIKPQRMRQVKQPRFESEVAYIPLTSGHEAIIDAKAWPLLSDRNWWARVKDNGRAYACAETTKEERDRGFPKRVHMHRLLIEVPEGMEVDHINRNPLDNRCENLRVCTRNENQQNRAAFKRNPLGMKGVRAYGWGFKAIVRSYGKTYDLGVFSTPDEAADAYDVKARELHGKFFRPSRSATD